MNTKSQSLPEAGMIIHNGRIATLEKERPFVPAVAIAAGRFIAVGSGREVMAYKGDTTKVIDVKGRTVIPGLNDSHSLHFIHVVIP